MTRRFIPQAVTWVAGGIGAGSALHLLNQHGAGLVIAGAGLAIGCGTGVIGYRKHRRETLIRTCREALAPTIGAKGTLLAKGWREGTPRRLVIRYASTAQDDAPTWRTNITETLERRLGCGVRIIEHDRRKLLLIIETTSNREADPEQDRISRTVADLMGRSARVTKIQRHETGKIKKIHVTGIPTTKLATPGYRTRVERTFGAVHNGRWRCQWDLTSDRMHFEVRPDFPGIVRLPVNKINANQNILATYDKVKIPFAVDEDGNEVVWRPAHDPNLMVVGAPGTGKTVFQHSVLATVVRYGWPVWVVDGKAIEFLGWRTWPNVQIVASTIEEQAAVITRTHELMEHRYQLINNGKASEEDFEPLLLFLDEWADFRQNLLAWYTHSKPKGAPTKPRILALVGSIARKGRSARIHLVFGTQRPDAEYFGGDMRDNFRARISLGSLSPQGAMMVWQDPTIGVAIPRLCRGRATTINDANRPIEVQTYFVQDPRKAHRSGNPDDLQQLNALMPDETMRLYERLLIVPPDYEDISNKGSEYQAWCTAAWTRASARPDLDPVNSSKVDHQRSRAMASPMTLFGLDHRSLAAPALEDADDELTEDLTEITQTIPDLRYSTPEVSDPMSLSVGDQVEIEPDVWVTVDEIPDEDPMDPDQVAICWRDDEGNEGIYSLSWTDRISSRQPLMEEAA